MSGPMRVLYVSPNAAMGGAERVTLDLISHHDRRLVEPSICFLHDGPLTNYCREVLAVPTFVVEAPPLRRLLERRRTVKELANLIRSSGVDLVHSAMAWGHLYGGAAARSARKPAVFFQHVGASWRSTIEAAASLVKASAIIANSEYTARGQRKVNPRRAPIHVVHPGTSISEEPLEQRRARGRAALGLEDGHFAVGIAARLQRPKGQDVFLRAAASLVHARPHSRVFVIGAALFGLDQEWESELKKLAAELGIERHVTFTGFRDDVPDLLAGLDVAVVSSVIPESFGLGLIEAMANGTPVIGTDGGATREIIEPAVNGLIVPPGDHEALATALLALCDDPEARAALALAGEQTARERFDAELMTRAVEEIYRGIAAR